MCFAELSSIYAKSGGIYEYSKKAFGDFIGFLTGWTGWIVANIAIAMLVTGGIEYLSSIIELSYFTKITIAVSFVLFINYVNLRGIDVSAKMLMIFASITLTVVISIIILGSGHVNIGYLKPFFVYPNIKILASVFLVMETFFGWESITYLSEETKNPKKIIPIAMIISTTVIATLAVLMAFVSLTVVPWQELGKSTAPMTLVLSKIIGSKYAPYISGLIFFNIMGTASAWIIVTPRLIYAMAKDKMLPEVLSEVHKKYRVPHIAILFQTIITCFVLLSGSFRLLLGVVVPLALFMYITVIFAVPKLRIDKPKIKRAFKVPFPFIIPILITSVLIFSMLLGSSLSEILLGLVFVALGIPLYIIAVLGYHTKFIKWFNNNLAWLTYRTYNFFVLKHIEPHILNYLSDPTVERIADIGCGIGGLTHQIAKKVIPLHGAVYGIDFAEKEIEIAKWHQEIRGVKNIEYHVADIYKVLESKELKRKLKKLDAVIGIGVLQYLPDVDKALKIVNRMLKKKGKIYFVDYDYIGKLFEKSWIEHDDKIIEMFSKAGFKVKIWRQKRLLWQYVHIYGYKK